MEPRINKHLIFDHFAGKSTPMQKRLIEDWLRSPPNREAYYHWLVEWEHQSPQYLPGLESKVETYIDYIDNNPTSEMTEASPTESISSHATQRHWLRWLTAATVLLIFGTIGWLNQGKLFSQTHTTGYNETKTLLLSDGTEVVMNANSSLRVPRFGFGSQTREVMLEGEANFSVTHTPNDQKFIVQAYNGLNIVVLGTEFTVFTRPRGAKVVLNKGKVKLRYGKIDAREEVTMAPGELVTLDREGHAKLSKTTNSQPQKAWAAHRFVFEGTSLEELTHLFHDNFGLKIEIGDEELKATSLYGSFRAESAEQFLQELSAAANLRYEEKNDTIYILPNTL